MKDRSYVAYYSGHLGAEGNALDNLVAEWLDTFAGNETRQEVIFGLSGDPLEEYHDDLKLIYTTAWKRCETIFYSNYLENSTEELRKVSEIAKKWDNDQELQDLLKTYRNELGAAFYEFNKQFMLYRFERVCRVTMFQLEKHIKLKTEIEEKFIPELYKILDSSYYREAIYHFQIARGHLKELREHEIGKYFVPETEEIKEFYQKLHPQMSYKPEEIIS